MKEQNKFIPYPKETLQTRNGDLENLLFVIAESGVLEEQWLPRELTANAIEQHANWLAELTMRDPDPRSERGAYVHIDMRSKKLIFPSNPTVGRGSVAAVLSRKPHLFSPMLNIHTHPDNSCFSGGYYGGMSVFLYQTLRIFLATTGEIR